MDLKILILTFLLCTCGIRLLSAEEPTSEQVQEFLNVHLSYAQDQALMAGIPVSFTLGQAMIESNYGRSELATKANNFFGIKGIHGWDGAVYYIKSKEQDRNTGSVQLEGSNFRQYADIAAAYEDRLIFLWSSSRYADLFKLASNDYKGWAKGIHDAGYATASDYAVNIINFIEKHNLQQYDMSLAASEILLNKFAVATGSKENVLLIKDITRSKRDLYQQVNKHSAKIIDAAEKYGQDLQLQINDLKRMGVNIRKENQSEHEALWDKIHQLEALVIRQNEYINSLQIKVADLERQVQGIYASDPLLRNTEMTTGNSLFPIQKSTADGIFYIAGKKAVQIREGQTLLDVAHANNIEYKNLLQYNELTAEVVESEKKLPDNLYIYLEPKANIAGDESLTHQVRSGENLYLISQLYGIKIQRLYARNNLNIQSGEEPLVGEFIFINKKAPSKPKTRPISPNDNASSLFNAGGGYGVGR